ncbi:hypothetical protein BOW53_13465 [Solemya pervernicosa gill symbiont]|uniref:DNA 3'-5' helicase II n=1 Tax=Solemya pervernicosa gill symbiont TaxID=642797 RepID=A0A1T2L1L0_9GAMM|nr:AAA family ATPase [Solemya pervernicosa gill symbiont]OOZ38961.1 hypothetical protein BOW53_13465 [Solemya pervernicosa gill symbiont]
MDNSVILAVAGSGKTTHIINSIDTTKSNLIITYTENNFRNLRNRIIREYDGLPERTRVYTYFTFLYSFCLRPLCGDRYGLKGINFDIPPEFSSRQKNTNLRRYIDSHGRIYSCRIASFIINFNLVDDVKARIKKYFDYLYVDEIQDFTAGDFNLLIAVSSGNTDSLLVGDFYQHTFGTSHDGNLNKSLYKDFGTYKKRLEDSGLSVDETTLSHSYRCSPTTCEFVTNNLGITIDSHQTDTSIVDFVEDEGWAEVIFGKGHTVKLFYQSHNKYPCYSDNWGASKGLDNFDSVCVVLNKTTEQHFRKGSLHKLAPTTRNKFYVACTRARSELLFVPESYLKKYKV